MEQFIERIEKSAGIVVFRREESRILYLLLNYQGGHWDFSKGHVEKGETCRQAAIRELKEETGIEDIRLINNFEEGIKYSFRSYAAKEENRLGLIAKSVVFYLAETQQQEVKISGEHSGYEWLDFDKAMKRVTFANAKKILKKANDFLIEP